MRQTSLFGQFDTDQPAEVADLYRLNAQSVENLSNEISAELSGQEAWRESSGEVLADQSPASGEDTVEK